MKKLPVIERTMQLWVRDRSPWERKTFDVAIQLTTVHIEKMTARGRYIKSVRPVDLETMEVYDWDQVVASSPVDFSISQRELHHIAIQMLNTE